jgi:hypothetical protein
VIDVRQFRIAVDARPAAEIALSARIVDKNGKVVAARLFEESEKFDQAAPPAAVAAFSEAFGRIAQHDRLDHSGVVGETGASPAAVAGIVAAVDWTLFEGLQVRQQVVNLVGVELKLRHGRMTGLDAFGERLSQGFDRIALVQCPEWRRDLERAWADPVDGVTSSAIIEREGLAALLVG